MEYYERPKEDSLGHWIVPNSVIARDVVPIWRRLGGGTTKSDIQPDLKAAYEQAIQYTAINIASAKAHKRKLEAAMAAITDSKESEDG